MRPWQFRQVPEGCASVFERAVLAPMTRRLALRRGAVAAGAVASLSLADAVPALADAGAQPKPIPGGFDQNFNIVPSNPFIHVMPPALGVDMSTITDFSGTIAAAEIQGTARGSDGTSYTFDADMRFMQGTYVGRDGIRRTGSFGFV